MPLLLAIKVSFNVAVKEYFLKNAICFKVVFFRGEQFITKLSEVNFVFCYFVSERRREREAQKEASMEEMKVSVLRTTWGLSIFKCKGSEKIKF